MKKKVLGIIAFAAIAAVAGWNYNQNLNKIDDVELSDLVLENVEALASGEGDGLELQGYKLVNNCCEANHPRDFFCNSVWSYC